MSDIFRVKSRIREYEVEFIEDFLLDISKRAIEGSFVVIDEKVNELYGEGIKNVFICDNILVVRANEESKTLAMCEDLIGRLIAGKIRKNSVIFAVGGGVVEDLTAFVSTVLFRGIDWIFYPTTLLAQGDSCIGSKSSINFKGYKNLIGSFYPPDSVVIDINFLSTLPPCEIKSGIGEILHFYFFAGEIVLAEQMMSNYDILIENPCGMKAYVLKSLKIKKEVIEEDEFDKGKRNLFNYGHTFGHAIESVSEYSVSHGQAVTLGMDIANYVSMRQGFIGKNVYMGMRKILEKNMPAFMLDERKTKHYMNALSKDKKNVGNDLGCILSKGPGKMFKIRLPINKDLESIMRDYFAGL